MRNISTLFWGRICLQFLLYSVEFKMKISFLLFCTQNVKDDSSRLSIGKILIWWRFLSTLSSSILSEHEYLSQVLFVVFLLCFKTKDLYVNLLANLDFILSILGLYGFRIYFRIWQFLLIFLLQNWNIDYME